MAIVFLTGGTGFVGGATLVSLLADARVEQVILLVRARDPAQARERVAASLARFEMPMPAPGRVEAIPGSLADVRLPAELRERLTHAVHAAAHTSFRSVRTARETNVEGTRALAQALAGAPKLERLLFVGTAFRLGMADAGLVEEDLPSSAEHVAEYTRTKAEAEAVLEQTAGIPLVIARPSIVVGHTRLGVKPSASLFWFYRAIAKAGISPFSDERRRDIVPVDWTAEALVQLLLKRTLRHARYHVSAGEGSAETWASIRAKFAECGQAAPASRCVDAASLRDHPAWDAWMAEAVMACAKFSRLPYDVFSNRRLLEEGVPPPPRFTSYLPRCLESSDRTVDEQARDDV